jgi:MerR family transcriptional regulator, thiopeptide resistance regulator
MYRITELARQFGLSRSTLLYYDRIGLLCPSLRSAANYRSYSAADRERLASICSLKRAGLEIRGIRTILAAAGNASAAVLQSRLHQIAAEINALQTKQRLLAGMLRLNSEGGPTSAVDKTMFVEMLRAAGMDDDAMKQLHVEFERRAPQAHHNFLLSLGIAEVETLAIRAWSAALAPEPTAPVPPE